MYFSARRTLFGMTLLLSALLTAVMLSTPLTAGRQAAPQGDIGEFVAFCPYSHSGPNDPIVHPAMPGMSHMHDFLGNVTTVATSTVESLLDGNTTCNPVEDRSAYWTPTLYDAGGAPVAFEQVTIYYLVDIDEPTTLQPYPLGLKIVAGNAAATSPPNPSYFKWSCLGAPDSSTSEIVVCPAGSRLELLLNFPDCWDGANLDSADHKSHMAYSAAQTCPTSHPVPVPRLQFKLRYATSGEAGMTLASGPGYTMHGDFFNAWEPEALANRMQCLYNLVKCGPEGYPEDGPLVTPPPTLPAPLTPAPTQPSPQPTRAVFMPVVRH